MDDALADVRRCQREHHSYPDRRVQRIWVGPGEFDELRAVITIFAEFTAPSGSALSAGHDKQLNSAGKFRRRAVGRSESGAVSISRPEL